MMEEEDMTEVGGFEVVALMIYSAEARAVHENQVWLFRFTYSFVNESCVINL